MDFRVAIELAKANPGAMITRSDEGDFVVRWPDGTEVATGAAAAEHSEPDDNNVYASFDHAFRYLREQNEELKTELEYWRDLGTKAIIKNESFQVESATLIAERDKLKITLSMVSAAELNRIKAEAAAEQAAYAKTLREERKTMRCGCAGEVENCPRCLGSGTYTVDGYGNRV